MATTSLPATPRPAIRTPVDAVILTPKEEARGLLIDIDGRLNAIMDLASGWKPVREEGMFQVVAEEGLEPPTRGL